MAEKWMIVLLRLTAVVLLTALFPAVMPFAWMDATHQWLGLGKLPDAPIVGYLTRSLSALYAVHGVLVLYLSLDVRRFLPVIRCVAVHSGRGPSNRYRKIALAKVPHTAGTPNVANAAPGSSSPRRLRIQLDRTTSPPATRLIDA